MAVKGFSRILCLNCKAKQLLRRCQNWKLHKQSNCGAAVEAKKERSDVSEKVEEAFPLPQVSLPAAVDVVVVGGGSIGCNTLYHLTKLGVRNVVLLEREQITSGTTWHSAGILWRLNADDSQVILQNYTRHLLKNVLIEETAISTGWIETGALLLASTKERMQELKKLHSFGKVFNIESHCLSPTDTKKLYPLMNVEDVYGSLFSPGDGTLDPTGFCTALIRAAVSNGAKVLESCPLLDVQLYEDNFGVKRVNGVVTPFGVIKTRYVVNCAGVWSPTIGKMAGVSIPLRIMQHAYVITNGIQGIETMPVVRDQDSSIYIKRQGDALAIGGYERNPVFVEKIPSDFAFSLFDLDWDIFQVHLTAAIKRIPALEEAGIKATVCGPESFTPDHKPVLGEDPFVRGFYHGYGFNSGGMMLSGGCGRELARWIVYGRPELDMYAFDIRRFNRSLIDNMTWIKERCHESYARHHKILFVNDQPLSGRNFLKDPFHEELLQQGCVFELRHGWERAGWFAPDGASPVLKYDYYGNYGVTAHDNYKYLDRLLGDCTFDFPKHHDVIKRECLNCRENVAVFNMSYFGKFYLLGPDAQAAADWLFTNDMTNLNGSTVYTCMLNKRGCVEADLTVSPLDSGDGGVCDPQFVGPRGFYIVAGGSASFHNWAHLNSVIKDNGFNVELIDKSREMGVLSVQGPKSRQLLRLMTDADLSDGAFPFSTHKLIRCEGQKVRAVRLSFVGELGWELHIPNEACVKIYRQLMEKGKVFNVTNGGYRAINSLSMEKGYRHWHVDVRLDDTPLEAGLGFTCRLKEPTPFLGRLALEQQKKNGLRKRLACFTIDEYLPLWGKEAILRDEQPVGFLRCAEYAFALGKTIGYGYVHRPDGAVIDTNFLKSGTFELERMGVRIPAVVHLRSPFDPKFNRLKGIYDEILPYKKEKQDQKPTVKR